ncbi:hypothetical protein N9824_00390 [bacterium]|nr:hypothetical protein [bacterium]
MKKPKLALIPSGYGDGKLYSVMPTNGSGDFAFSRGSGATRINKDGLIETMTQTLGDELITNGYFSADSDWIKGTGWSISGGTANCDGTANNAVRQNFSLPTGTLRIKFDVTARTLGSVNLWINKPAFSQLISADAIGSYEIDVVTTSGANNIYFYSTNLFNGSIDNVSVKEVISGLDTPRLDYPLIDGVVSGCPSVLLEPQRTNLIQWSDLFSASSTGGYYGLYWNAIITDNNAISPDGSLNASKVVRGTDDVLIRALSVVTVSTENTATLWAKKGNYDKITLDIGDEATSTITLTDEWQRIETTTSSALNTHVDISMPNSASGDYIYIYGFQVEEGSYATSYIPTNGTAVTRLADAANGAGDATTFNDSEGVLMFEGSFPASTTSSNLRIAISDTTANNRVLIQNVSASANRLQFYVIVGGVTSTDINLAINNIATFNKIVFKYKENDFSVFINGFEVLTDTSGITFPNGTLTELAFDGGDGAFDFYGKTKQIQYFQTALNDSELEELTSWESFTAMAYGQLYTIE